MMILIRGIIENIVNYNFYFLRLIKIILRQIKKETCTIKMERMRVHNLHPSIEGFLYNVFREMIIIAL